MSKGLKLAAGSFVKWNAARAELNFLLLNEPEISARPLSLNLHFLDVTEWWQVNSLPSAHSFSLFREI